MIDRKILLKTIKLMAEYIVEQGMVDIYLCDDIPEELHLKYQSDFDGIYDNASCQRCVVEYFVRETCKKYECKEKRIKDFTEVCVDEGYLEDWYITSVDSDTEPKWTEKHIEELCHDFIIIPREQKENAK